MRTTAICCLLATICLAPTAAKEGGLFDLAIGDPERKDARIDLALDRITDSRTGEILSPGELAQRLEGTRLLLVGESHTSVEFHRVQLRVIQELARAGREVIVGLEMYPYTEQPFLDQWSGGLLTEEGFVELSRWYRNWGYHWNYYREIFLFARESGLRMYAVNTPREVVSAIRKKGFEGLTEEEAAHVPVSVDTDNDDHRKLFRTMFEGDDDNGFHATLTDEQLDGMFRAQCTWDATMAHNAVTALDANENPRAIMVVLVGSGHVSYGLGVQRQASLRFDGKISSLIPIPVNGEDGAEVSRVRASYADFVWGVWPEQESLYPGLGLSTRKDGESERRAVIHVPDESLAAECGFQVGDLLLTMNGVDLVDREAFTRSMSEMRWGDKAEFTVRRGEQTVTLPVHFHRERPESCETESE